MSGSERSHITSVIMDVVYPKSLFCLIMIILNQIVITFSFGLKYVFKIKLLKTQKMIQ